MKLNGGINFCESGLTTSIRAMHLQTEVFGIINENYNSFDKVGYQWYFCDDIYGTNPVPVDNASSSVMTINGNQFVPGVYYYFARIYGDDFSYKDSNVATITITE